MNGRTYQIPGPAPITCSGGGGNNGGGGNPSPTSSAGGSQPTGGNGGGGSGTVPLYAQCGGNGYTGPTACAQGTCKAQNEWYSQCTP